MSKFSLDFVHVLSCVVRATIDLSDDTLNITFQQILLSLVTRIRRFDGDFEADCTNIGDVGDNDSRTTINVSNVTGTNQHIDIDKFNCIQSMKTHSNCLVIIQYQFD